ncbi:undecaprenyl-diphosphate phosphatase [Pseudodesulfovibrio sp. zrk46]|uniref:undecaprenyl-diphosphate phosphatase n=1 Tax=Pseudodesulfovibrio sp. zrk46 TaxID=2725288 RepID=UPI001448EFFC|nr:undecaprenyl-diphosphate phosphatase [Pseudodesulfovibrio sp. zrk46]QJB55337.1 undecaprenyl-diphosphate phosphatase [Pseudodesulfovibrio sp. zrk46]
MDNWYLAVILGIVEGLTEFLPISSTGHLIITGHLLGYTGAHAETFEVAIQLGAILAVVVLYRDIFLGLLTKNPDKPFSGMRGIGLLILTSIPASVVGLLAHSYIKSHLFNPITVSMALFVGAIIILIVEQLNLTPKTESIDEVTPGLALGIGFFQCLALWPGFSRSAATIMGGMILGAKRTVAAEYSFIAAVPIMVAATGYDLLKSYQLFSANDALFLAIGFITSFITALAAIKLFIVLLQKITLRGFAYYRLIVAPIVFFTM